MTFPLRPLSRRSRHLVAVGAAGVVAAGAVLSAPSAYADDDDPLIVVSAHRGGDPAKQNSMRAFQRAVDAGLPEIEVDAWVLKNGDATAVYHNEEFGQECSKYVGVVVRSLTRKQVNRVTCNDQPVPTVAQVTNFVSDHDINLRLELKSAEDEPIGRRQEHAKLLAQRVKASKITRKTIMQSFRWTAFRGFRRGAPNVRISALTATPGEDGPAKAVRFEADEISYYYPHSTPRLNRSIHRAGLTSAVWTVDSVADAKQVAADGADVIITDIPRTIRKALGGGA